MSDFWNKKNIKTQEVAYQEAESIQLDEQAVAELQEDPELDLFEEEDQDNFEIMSDANLRLEQGRLYQMVLQGNIFADTNADPKAIRNVQREIRKYVRERMETMLGIRQEQAVQERIVSSPFNDMEVEVLKMLASRMSKGQTEAAAQPGPQAPPPTPKKDGITSISGNLRPETTPIKATPKPVQKAAPKQAAKQAPKSAIKESESALQKPINEMTQEELAAYNAKAEERSKQKYAQMPNNLTPHPSTDQLTLLYTMQANDRLAQHAQKMEPSNNR